jgi:hypothetical protein
MARQLRLPTTNCSACRRCCVNGGLGTLVHARSSNHWWGCWNHACKVIRSGRAFLRRILHLLHSVHRPPNSPVPIRLNAGFRADLAWWLAFLRDWNGISFLLPPASLPRVEIDDIRRFRFLGLRWMAWAGLVPGPMGPTIRGPVDSREGVDPNHSGLCSLGQGLGWPSGDLPL